MKPFNNLWNLVLQLLVMMLLLLGICYNANSQQEAGKCTDTLTKIQSGYIEVSSNEDLIARSKEGVEYMIHIKVQSNSHPCEYAVTSNNSRSIQIYRPQIEDELVLEDWMIEKIDPVFTEVAEDPEPEIEDWMLAPIISKENLAEPAEEPQIEIEGWMLNIEEWPLEAHN